MSAPHDVRKNFRLTAKEAAKLSAFAAEAEVTESEYVRALIADPGHVFTAERDVLGRMLRELKRQGVNLNQIAHAANVGKFTRADAEALADIAAANARIADAVISALQGGRHADR